MINFFKPSEAEKINLNARNDTQKAILKKYELEEKKFKVKRTTS